MSNTTTTALDRYSATIRNIPVLDKAVFNALATEYKNGNESLKTKLVRHNLRLVVKCAKAYKQDENRTLDMIQEGNEGLIRAVELFDPSKGNAFSTYAEHWIRYRIELFLNKNNKMADVPLHTMKLTRKVEKIVRGFVEKDIEYTVEMIADKAGVKESKIVAALNLLQSDSSLNAKVGNEDGASEVVDFMPSDTNVQEQIEEGSRNSWLHLKVSQLPPNQRDALIHFYGLFNASQKTGADIGRILGLSRERVRQLVAASQKFILESAQKEGVRPQDLGLV